MVGPLALVGGDELHPGNEPQDALLAAAAGDGPAYVMATAAARHRPELAVAHAHEWFARFDLDVVELPVRTRTQARSSDTAELAALGRFFYLVGGDPGIVPDVLLDSPVWQAVASAWRSGAALAGSSAGAMAMGQWTLIRGRYPGDRRRRYRDALGLVPGIAVLPHFATFGREWVASALEERPSDDVVLLGIDERAAAVWSDGVWQVMGDGDVTVIMPRGERIFGSGDVIAGLPSPSAF
ncbi:MAG: Type 1 glutamine amidotransferase-like domain-containing protein [Actinomycetota bacterium]